MLGNNLMSLLALLGAILIGGIVLVTACWLVLRSRRSPAPKAEDGAPDMNSTVDPWEESGRRYGDDDS